MSNGNKTGTLNGTKEFTSSDSAGTAEGSQ